MTNIEEKWEGQPIIFQKRTKERVLQLIRQAEWDENIKRYLPEIIKEYNGKNPDDRIEILQK